MPTSIHFPERMDNLHLTEFCRHQVSDVAMQDPQASLHSPTLQRSLGQYVYKGVILVASPIETRWAYTLLSYFLNEKHQQTILLVLLQ